MTADETDETLMTRIAACDQRALRVLMERHMTRAIGLAERVVRSNAEADDIGQEAFLRVWRHAPSFDPAVARFTTWLYRIVVNMALDRARRPRHEPIDAAGEVASGELDVLGRLVEDERGRTLARAMAALPERQRAAVALFHMEGLSGREAAAAMNLGEKAFESLLVRARAALRQHVAAAMAVAGGNHDVG